MPNLVDSHCHLNFDPLREDLENVLVRAQEKGVGHMLCVSVTLEAFTEIKTLTQRHPIIFASVGVHPNERDGHDPVADELVSLAADTRVVAIGETGLDYYRSTGDMGWQQDRFRQHIRAAKACGKPLIIHTRDARADTIRIMQEEGAGDIGGVMHCFTESWEMAKQALELGFFISFSGIVTFKNADSLRQVAKQVPSDRILVETDCPYLAPVPYRGKTNEPAYVLFVAQSLAELRTVTLNALADETTDNFFRLFNQAKPVFQ